MTLMEFVTQELTNLPESLTAVTVDYDQLGKTNPNPHYHRTIMILAGFNAVAKIGITIGAGGHYYGKLVLKVHWKTLRNGWQEKSLTSHNYDPAEVLPEALKLLGQAELG